MKKKLTVATVLILLLAVCLTMLVGCDEMFTENAERNAMQVVASVNYDGQTENIYKFELVSQFNNYAYAYHNYYGMSYEAIADYLLQNLAQQKLLVMYAYKKVPTLMDPAPENVTGIADLLSKSELNRAIENTNNSLLTQLKSLVEDNITEDKYNNGSSTTKPKDDDDDTEITEAVLVRFDSNGGSEVERQRIQKGTTAKEPTEPTKDGYTFYGWYQDPEAAKTEDNIGVDEFDFESTVNNSITLYAKWVKFVPARNEIPEVEEEEDYDPDDDSVEVSAKFFTYAKDKNSEEYIEKIYNEFLEEDYVKTMNIPDGSSFENTLNDYIQDNLATLETNFKSNLFKSTIEECYEYALNEQYESLLVAKLQRLIGETVTVTDEEIEAEFNRIKKDNEGTFIGTNADSNYSSALTSKLDQTYYHLDTEKSYGFVINILLKLDDDRLEKLKDAYTINPSNTKALVAYRNQLISEIEVNVSNPNYDSTTVVEDSDGNEIELRDPMTDPNNPYNNVGKTESNPMDTSGQKEGGNNYNQILSFEKKGDSFEIVFNATEHSSMAYLTEKVPAFDKDGKIGIIHQIQNSFAQVTAFVESGELTRVQGVYWLREVATKWLYLVGDDTGAVTDSSNNGGLGYLVTPEGKTSSFLEDFTDYARKLVENGTGAYSNGEFTADTFNGANANGDFAGNGVAFVVADSFIGSGASDLSSAYAGVFVLLNSYTVWDNVNYDLPEDGVLPYDYIITYGKDEDSTKTIKQNLEDTLLAAKQARAYNLDVNTMGVEYMQQVTYNRDAYKSLWKNLD